MSPTKQDPLHEALCPYGDTHFSVCQKYPRLAPFYARLAQRDWWLDEEKDLSKNGNKQVIQNALRWTTGRAVRRLRCLNPYYPISTCKIRRIFWEDVEDYIEADVPRHFRVSQCAHWLYTAADESFLPLSELFRQCFGSDWLYMGAPHCTLWEGVKFCLSDYLLFHEMGGQLLLDSDIPRNVRDARLEHIRNALEAWCQILAFCLPIGEAADDEGTWLVLCAPAR